MVPISTHIVTSGVCHGSIVGSLLSFIYTLPLGNIIRRTVMEKDKSQRIHQDNSRGRLERMTTARFQENSGDDAPKEGGCDSTTVIYENKYEFCGYNLKITRFINANLGFSAYVWQAGIALCRYFEKEKISFTGRKVIELGSGTGIVGILAALLGGDVTMTDKPNILKQIENNVSINIPTARRHRLKVSALTWGENHTDFPTDYDFILGSDIVYSSVTYPALIETLRHLADRGATIYLSSEIRKGNGSPAFHMELLPQYFNCRVIDRLEDKDITVYKMTKIGTSPGDGLPSGDVTMTDKPDFLKQIENNVSINIPTARRNRLKVSALTWGENHTDFPTDYDFILGSDIVYSSVTYPALIETLRHLADRGVTNNLSSKL
ncbi:EEF1A lysine methyltransferase 3-like [Heptranchias perlo]|uniref:EEF1A lysine methyltransferase 3-like n=1 Tax=Heptranchias perlo TaxID=212740 RepID=UPI00355A8AD2